MNTYSKMKKFLMIAVVLVGSVLYSCNPPQSANDKAANRRNPSNKNYRNQNYSDRRISGDSDYRERDYYSQESSYQKTSRYANRDDYYSQNSNYDNSYGGEYGTGNSYYDDNSNYNTSECVNDYETQNSYYYDDYAEVGYNDSYNSNQPKSSQYRGARSMKPEIQELARLTKNMRANHTSYTESDWDRVATKYYRIEEKLAKNRYTQAELQEIGRLRGECLGYFSKMAIKETQRVIQEANIQMQSGLEGFLDAMSEGN